MRPLALSLAASLLFPALASAAEPDSVQLNLNQFLKLYEDAKNRPKDPEAAPRDHALAAARYKGRVIVQEGEPKSAVFTATFRIEVLKDKGWVRVPLLPTSVAIQSAKIGNVEAPVVVDGGYYTLVTDKKGAFDVTIELATSVFTSEGKSGFSFQMVPSGATEVELAVPAKEDLAFTVANAKVQTDKIVGADRVVNATLPSTGALSVSWQRKVEEAAKEDPKLYAEVYTLVGVGDGLLTATSTIHHTILFAGVDTLQVQVPEGMTLLDVKGTGIREWAVKDRNLTVQLTYAAEGAYPLTLEMERPLTSGSQTTTAPVPVPLKVERSKGWVGVEARGNLEIAGGDVKGAAPVDVRALPAAILGITGNPVLLGYKYLAGTPTVPLVVSEHADVDVLVTLLDQATATTMWTVDGRRLTSVRYQVRNNRRQFLRLAMPEGAEVWSASVGGRAVQPAKAADGRVMIPLVRSQASGGSLAAFEVEVVYVEQGDAPDAAGKGEFKATLPRPDVPTTWVGWSIYAPEDAKVLPKSVDGNLRGVEWLSSPVQQAQVHHIETAMPQQQAATRGQTNAGAMGQGAVPVPVSLPLEGTPTYYEKLLSVNEDLTLSYRYKGLKK
jgi:hypothetical protein